MGVRWVLPPLDLREWAEALKRDSGMLAGLAPPGPIESACMHKPGNSSQTLAICEAGVEQKRANEGCVKGLPALPAGTESADAAGVAGVAAARPPGLPRQRCRGSVGPERHSRGVRVGGARSASCRSATRKPR